MDKIWNRIILRSRRSLAVVAGMNKRMTTQNGQKSKAKKNMVKFLYIIEA